MSKTEKTVSIKNNFSWIREKSGHKTSPKKTKKNQHLQDCNEYELKFRNHEIHQNSSNRHHHTKTPSPEFSSNDSDAGFRA